MGWELTVDVGVDTPGCEPAYGFTGWGHRRTPEVLAGPGRPGLAGLGRGGSLPLWLCSLHARLLMSLGPWPALKEPRVLKMVTRKEGKATAQLAALKFLGAGHRLWAGLAGAGPQPLST